MNILQPIEIPSADQQPQNSGFTIREVNEDDLDLTRELQEASGLQLRARYYDRWRFFTDLSLRHCHGW